MGGIIIIKSKQKKCCEKIALMCLACVCVCVGVACVVCPLHSCVTVADVVVVVVAFVVIICALFSCFRCRRLIRPTKIYVNATARTPTAATTTAGTHVYECACVCV